jgi:hypothetical protein
MQSNALSNWHYFVCFPMIFVALPFMVILKEDFKKDFDHKLVMAPATLTWFALIIVQFYVWIKIRSYYTRVMQLHKSEKAYTDDRTIEDFKKLAWPTCMAFNLAQPINIRGNRPGNLSKIESARYTKGLY